MAALFDPDYWSELIGKQERRRQPMIIALHELHRKHCSDPAAPRGAIDDILGYFLRRDPFDDFIVPVENLRNIRVPMELTLRR